MQEGLPSRSSEIIDRNLPVADLLSLSERAELEGKARVLLEEKAFEGCGGLELTEEMRTTVAAHAALLITGRDTTFYPRLGSVLVYPSSFVAPVRHPVGDAEIETAEERLGESSAEGAVVISWEDVLADLADPDAATSVILHEFAHQLDDENPGSEGCPVLERRRSYAEWAQVFSSEYDLHVADVEAGRPTLIDEYGAESPAEFFAVAVESFFLLPVDLSHRHPELYAQLAVYFHLDPAAW